VRTRLERRTVSLLASVGLMEIGGRCEIIGTAITNATQLPPGYSYQMRGQTKNLDETTDNLILAMAPAGIFVYMVLAAQFESFVQPLIITTVLPLSVPFALFRQRS
jgi:multidrug efflux pump subunit AcrB